MRTSLSIAFCCLTASVAVAQRPSPGRAELAKTIGARVPGPTLRIVDSLLIDTKTLKLDPPLNLFVGPKGKTIVHSQYSHVMALDSMGRRLWSHAPERRREIADVTAVGFNGDEMWVTDAGFSQIALFDQYGNVTKSLELPEWIRPTFSQRKTFPVFESMRVYSIFADGSMLVVPRRGNSLVGTTGYDAKSSYVLKVSDDGIIQRTIARFPNNMQMLRSAKGDSSAFENPVGRPFFRISPDGMRTVVVQADTMAAKTDTIVIRAFNDRGDTVYTQKLTYPAATFTETQIDSIGRQRFGGYDADYREPRTKALPRRVPPVFDVVLDFDKSVWITMRGSAEGRPVVGLDPAGKVMGSLQLPPKRMVKAADRGRLWIGDFPAIGRYLVRYTVRK